MGARGQRARIWGTRRAASSTDSRFKTKERSIHYGTHNESFVEATAVSDDVDGLVFRGRFFHVHS
jgi:hypothetical protein